MSNYSADVEFERIINEQNGRVLLHCCCAPCAAPALQRFASAQLSVDCFYFNPNIKPKDEYFKRGEQLKKLCAAYSVNLVCAEYDGAVFDSAVEGLENEKEGGERCLLCYYLRLEQTAMLAKHNGYDYFCTTLTLSPHKDSAVINRLGQEIAIKYGIKYLPSDFKKKNGNLVSKEICSRLDIYRQNYCGCTVARD